MKKFLENKILIFLLLFLFLFFPKRLKVQNLIFDSGFELIESNPTWYNPSNTTPDYHTKLQPGWWNYFNPVSPHSGDNFIHLSFDVKNTEYVSSRLTVSLKKGTDYCVRLFVMALRQNSVESFFLKNIPIAITKNKLKGNQKKLALNSKGVIFLKNERVLKSKNWVEVCGIFKASGGEKYFTIGLFGPVNYLDEIENVIEVKNRVNCSYFIDDVSILRETENECKCSLTIEHTY